MFTIYTRETVSLLFGQTAIDSKHMKHLYNRVDKRLLKEKLSKEESKRTTLSFYKYANIKNVPFFRGHLYALLAEHNVLGRIYVANEGINGQVSVPTNSLNDFKASLDSIVFLKDVRLNIAIEDDGKSFYKLNIKVKDKIVADGLDDSSFDVTDRGKHIKAEEFNALISDDNTLLIDMRNHYESEVGHFENAICPDVETFRESLPIVEDILKDKKHNNIVMYCTGGIRCEKASAYFIHKGFKHVHQLDGGIIEYAREVKKAGIENKFKGKNFVFDDRLGERISEDVISVCHQCGDTCDTHVNCANDACHILFIQCNTCGEKYESCCSNKCRDYKRLPEEDQMKLVDIEFNGTKFGKGRYKALHQHDSLDLE